jgi:hypothetical protein
MKQVLLALLLFALLTANAQEYFRIEIEENTIAGNPGIHSAAVGVYNNEWLIIGGRTNGLHGFNAIDPFTASGNNANIYLINPVNETMQSLSVNNLTTELKEALTVSNMQFYQPNDTLLYIIGGYGWNDSAQQFITSRALVAVNVKLLAQRIAAQNNTIDDCFSMMKDERLAVCGAHLKKIDDTYYLVFGHLFDGTYSRNNSGIHVQQYTRAIRKFEIDNSTQLSITNYTETYDSINFRRRDYNLVSQIFPDRSYGFTAFTGVFQEVFTLPYLNTIDINAAGYTINNTFNQNLSQYHSAVMPVYDSLHHFMHTFFFGGIGMYYRDTVSNTLVVDSLVPFVNTISMVSRDSLGNMTEYELPIRFPALLGTNAEFIPAENIKKLEGNIIDVNALNDKTLVGYIFGGIESPEQNISNTDPSNSFATQRIYKVFINKNEPDTTITANYYPIIEPASLKILPNPFDNSFQLQLKNLDAKQLSIKMFGANKQLIQQVYNGNEATSIFEIDAKHLAQGLYFIELRTDKYRKVYRVVKK